MGIIAHFVPFERHTTRTLWPSTCVERGLSERPLAHFSHFFSPGLKGLFLSQCRQTVSTSHRPSCRRNAVS